MPPPILLDLDGTLVDSLADIAASANHVRAQSGLPPLPVDRLRGMVGDGAQALLRRALEDAGEPVDLDVAWSRYRDHHRAQCTVFCRPFPGAVEALDGWRADGRAVAVVTNKPLEFAERILGHLGLDRFVGAVVGGDSLPQRKPAPEPLQLALHLLGVGPERAWMAGDGLQDLRAGRAAGLKTIGALYGYHDPAGLRAEGADVYWTAFGLAE